MSRLLVLALALVAACSYVDATTTQYAGVPRFVPTDAASVQVLSAEPKQRHDRLGEILLDISTDAAPPVEDVERKLREEAAKWGANAVYVVHNSISPRQGHKLVGIAVRLRD